MIILTKEIFFELLNKTNRTRRKMAGRWDYYSVVTKIINKLNSDRKIETVLELGPHSCPMVLDSDIMDYEDYGNIKVNFLHDAKITPWPIPDKKYDLFIALQVWEHLSPNQRDAFMEVKRISKYAILSFPYMWKEGSVNLTHKKKDKKTIDFWTCNCNPIFEKIAGKRTDRKPIRRRMVRLYRF